MSEAVWYCPVCHTEGTDENIAHCPHDGCAVASIADREAKWIGKTIDDKYRVIRFLGAGGMAEVFEVERISNKKRFALKLLKSAFAKDAHLSERFRQEAMLISLIAHPNIVALEDVGFTDDDINYMVMELLSGYSLSQAIKVGPIPPPTAFRIGLLICEGMAAAHERGVIHRDLKPENIYVHSPNDSDNPVIKILDLGIGKLFNSVASKGITLSGMVVGTPEYMCPEQCRGEIATTASDIYSMGIVMYEMLFGVVPFNDESPLLILPRHLSEDPSWDSKRAQELGIPPKTQEVILRALAKSQGDRQDSMVQLQKELSSLLSRVRHGNRFSLPSAQAVQKRISLSPVAAAPTIETSLSGPALPITDSGEETEHMAFEFATNAYWAGHRHGKRIECNPYLRIFRGNGQRVSVLIDPGPLRDIDMICQKISSVIDSVENLSYIFLTHAAPNVSGSVAGLQRINPRVLIICSQSTWELVRHQGLDPKRFIPVESVPKREYIFSTGHSIQFIPTPYCPNQGAVMLYDREASVLFSGDVCSGASTRNGFIFTHQDVRGLQQLHQSKIPSTRALKMSLKEIQRLQPLPRIIAPHHGNIIMDDNVGRAIDILSEVTTGIDLVEANEAFPQSLEIANEIVHIFNTVAGKNKTGEFLHQFNTNRELMGVIDLRAGNHIVGFLTESALAIETLIDVAQTIVPDALDNQLEEALSPIRKQLADLIGASRPETDKSNQLDQLVQLNETDNTNKQTETMVF